MTMAGPLEVLASGLKELGLADDGAVLERLEAWLQVHGRWAERMNLTGTRDPDTLVREHLLDAAAIIPALPDGTVLDVGSGAGLPGLVIAALDVERPVTLLDAQQRRTVFLEQAALAMQLARVRVVTARAESWQPDAPLAAVLARAVAPLPRLLAFTGHLLRQGTPLLAMKGPAWREEARELPQGYVIEDVRPYTPAHWGREHVLIRVVAREQA